MNTVIILSGLGVFSLVGAILNLRKSMVPLMVLGLVAAGVFAALHFGTETHHYHNMLFFDRYADVFCILLCIIGVCWFIGFGNELIEDEHRIEKFALVLFSAVGGIFMVSFNHLVMLFLGIEILSIPLYALAGSTRNDSFSIEAGLKYFLMSSFATAFILFGMALVYGYSGSFYLNEIGAKAQGSGGIFQLGLSLMILGLCFKVSAVPFHFWTPDVYEGAPTMFTAFMSTTVKIAAFAGFLRLLQGLIPDAGGQANMTLMVIAVLSLLVGNLMAVYPVSAKRLLAYSSISQAGYLLIPLFESQPDAQPVLLYGLAAYTLASFALFMIIYALEKNYGLIEIDSFNGLGKTQPALAFSISVCLLSLAGIPPLAGFMSKYFIFNQAIQSGHLALTVFAVLMSLVGVYYYFKIIIAMYFKESSLMPPVINASIRLVMMVLTIALLILGIFPDLVIGI